MNIVADKEAALLRIGDELLLYILLIEEILRAYRNVIPVSVCPEELRNLPHRYGS